LLFYGRPLLLKLFRRLEVGVNPDFEIGRFLTDVHPFARIPRTAGALEYYRPGNGPITLAILQERIANQGDGWLHALAELRGYYERVGGRDPAAGVGAELPPAAREAIGPYLDAAATLGRRTAELHLALAAGASDPAFAPEPLTDTDLASLKEGMLDQARRALALLAANQERLAGATAPAAKRLLDDAPCVLEQLAGGAPARVAAYKIRCHGDYHLGQVLWVDNDFYILDFEGEPTRTVEERRARQSPLKDVAGMLRSFHYAAYAGLFIHTLSRADEFDRLEPWADLWQRGTSATFLRAYRKTAGEAAFLPRGERAFAALLDAFMLDKAFYELAYELNNRPDWVRIPLRGIVALLAPGG
jgi:maltose alpha-D-glucosyltransferase/alpha-amylase